MTLGGIRGGNRKTLKIGKLRYLYLPNGWLDLDEKWYVERYCVSDAPFSIWIGSGDLGCWRGKQKSWKSEILENVKSGGIGMKLNGKNKHRFKMLDWHNWTRSDLFGGVGGISSTLASSVILDILERWKFIDQQSVSGTCKNFVDAKYWLAVLETLLVNVHARGYNYLIAYICFCCCRCLLGFPLNH